MKKKPKQKENNPWKDRFFNLLIATAVILAIVFAYSGWDQSRSNSHDAELDLNLSAAELMDLMEEADIQIYGHYGCSWCVQQIVSFNKTLESELQLSSVLNMTIEEFKQQELITRGLFVDCKENNESVSLCQSIGVEGTPAWVREGTIFRTGYVEIG